MAMYKYLMCEKCGLVIGSLSELKDGRCAGCGGWVFNCPFCKKQATHIQVADGKVTWNCAEGCNP